jgi:hypothetical protein
MTLDGEERRTMDPRGEVGEAVVASSIISGQIEFKLSIGTDVLHDSICEEEAEENQGIGNEGEERLI